MKMKEKRKEENNVKRRKFRLREDAERVMMEHQAELEKIMPSDRDSLRKLQKVMQLFKTTQAQLWDLQRYWSVSLDV